MSVENLNIISNVVCKNRGLVFVEEFNTDKEVYDFKFTIILDGVIVFDDYMTHADFYAMSIDVIKRCLTHEL